MKKPTKPTKPITTLLSNFLKEASTFLANGAPVVEPEVYTKRMKACYDCEHITENIKCGICGCHMEMKAKWGTASCPDTPPRWKVDHGKK